MENECLNERVREISEERNETQSMKLNARFFRYTVAQSLLNYASKLWDILSYLYRVTDRHRNYDWGYSNAFVYSNI